MYEFEASFMLDGLTGDANDVLITSSQLDHLSVCCIEKMAHSRRIRVYGTRAVGQALSEVGNLDFVLLTPLSPIKLGEITVLPLPANLKTDFSDEVALNFLFESESKTFFYGLDGAWIEPSAWQVLSHLRLDAVILDCAAGIGDYSGQCFNHNNLTMVRAIKTVFDKSGVTDSATKFILSHLPTDKRVNMHDELCEAVKDTQIKIAYDGYFLGI